MSNWNTFLKSIPAGVMIGLGVTAFISSENKVFGSILFCLGLFGICAFGFNLFTGKIGYVIPTKNNPNCLMIWLGNLVGCLITTVPLRFANPKYNEAAVVLAENKLSQNFLQTFILGIFLRYDYVYCCRKLQRKQQSARQISRYFPRYSRFYICRL